MSYYVRYFVDDQRPTTLQEIRSGVQQAGLAVQVSVEGELSSNDELLAQIEVNARGTDLFEDELNHFLRMLAGSPAAAGVQRRLQATRAVIAVQVHWQGQPPDLMSPFWGWLQTHRSGLLQADGHGFYDNGQLVLALS